MYYKKPHSTKSIGLFLTTMFSLSAIISIFRAIYNVVGFRNAILDPSISLSVLFALAFYISSRNNRVITKVMHTSLVYFAGLVAITGAELTFEIHGEFLIILSLLMAKIYGLIGKKSRYFIAGSILLCFLIKFAFNLEQIFAKPSDFFYYVVLISFFAIFFLLIFESEERKVNEEASIICDQWTKEQVYTDIGRTVFSTFMHDYHTDHAIVHLDTLNEMLEDGEVDDAKILVKELKNLLSDDNDNILRIKNKIRLSVKEKPEVVNSIKILKDKVRYFKRAYKLEDSDIEFFYHVDNKYDLYIVPIDFMGIIENLLKNAIEASKDEKRIKILMYIDRDICKISITNRGSMIPWRSKDGTVSIDSFRVGRTTKKQGSGWGVYSIIKRVEANNGKIKVTSRNGETEFCLIFQVRKSQRETVKQ